VNNDELVALVRREIDAAQGYDSDVLSSKRAAALNYYNGIMPAAPEGRSQIVSSDVADTVHALLAQIVPIFQSSIIEFDPESEEDEPQAQLETDFVSTMLQKSDGYQVLADAAHDALLIGNGWIKVYIDEQKEVHEEQYGDLDAMQLQAVSQPQSEGEEVKIRENAGGYQVRRTVTTRELKIETISPDVMLFSSACDQFDFQELQFVGERKLYTSSDLKAMGLKQQEIDSIPEAPEDYWPAITAREGIYQDENSPNEGIYQDAEKLRVCFDVYTRLDLNDDGTSELRHVIIGGDVLIENEPAECIPYATGSPLPMPHRVQGQGMFELMHQVQSAKTHTLRQYMDNLAVMNASRVGAVEGQVNMDDLTNGRINGVVRMRSPDAILPLPAADIGQQAVMGLNYLDTVREQRGGASLDLNDADRQIMSSSATAAAGQMANNEKMAGFYCRNLVQTLLADTHRLIHKKLRYEYTEPLGAKIRGKWEQTVPAEWMERKSITVIAGLTTTERNQKSQAYMMLLQQQQMALQAGGNGIITDMGKIYNASADWIRLQDIGAPDEYLLDPDSQEAAAAAQAQAEQQQQAAAQQQALIQEQMAIEREKIAQDRYKVDKETAFDYYNANLDAEVSEAEITSKAVLETVKIENVQRGADTKTGTDGA
jgi:hypothetical protein